MPSPKASVMINDLFVEGLGQVGLNRTFSIREDGLNPRVSLVGNRDGQIDVYLTLFGNERTHIGQYYYPDRPGLGLPSLRAWVVGTRIEPELKTVLHLDVDQIEQVMINFRAAERLLRTDLARKAIPWTSQLRFRRTRKQRVERE